MFSKGTTDLIVFFFALSSLCAFAFPLHALLSIYGLVEIGSQWGRDPVTEYLEAGAFFGLFAVIQAGFALRFYLIEIPQIDEALGTKDY